MGSRQFPIWVDVTNCNYKSSQSHGFRRNGFSTIFVGSSVNNSHYFISYSVHRTTGTYKDEPVMIFRFKVEKKVLKYAVFSLNKKGRADKLLKEVTKLNRLKSLNLQI